jgi:hypothetical protein
MFDQCSLPSHSHLALAFPFCVVYDS